MKIRKTLNKYYIEFERSDWTTGLAPKIIEGLKQINYKERRYDPETKEWSFTPTSYNREMLNIAHTAFKENKPAEFNVNRLEQLMTAWWKTFKACTNEEFDKAMKGVKDAETDPEWRDAWLVTPDDLFGIDPVDFQDTLFNEGVSGINKKFVLTRREYD